MFPHRNNEGPVNRRALLLENPDCGAYPGVAQISYAAPRNLRIGVLHSDHDPAHPGRNQRRSAGRSLFVRMGARLEIYICCRTAGAPPRILERFSLCMRPAKYGVMSAGDNAPAFDQDAAD